MEYELEHQWLILDENTVSELDYELGWAWEDGDDLKIPENTQLMLHHYNQWAMKWEMPYFHTWWSCGLFWTMWTISDLTWYKFTEEDILEIQKLAVDHYWLQVPWGMYMHKAVDCVRNWWNKKFPEQQLTSFRLKIGWPKYFEALKKWHSLVVWYKTSSEYFKDSQDDGIVQWTDFPKKWGHLVRTHQSWVFKVTDNYYWKKKFNTYTNNNLVKLKDNKVFFKSAYLILKTRTMNDEIKDNIDLDAAKEMFEKGYWNGLDPRKPMSRQEVMTVMKRILDSVNKG